MSRERRAQSVPPVNTVPPPNKEDTTLITRAKGWIEPWHYLVGVAIVLIGAGAAFADWSRDKATVKELDAAKVSVTAQVGALQGATAIQIGGLQAKVNALEAQQARVEGKLDVLLDVVTDVRDQLRRKRAP